MQYRELGRTGWNVSSISFGAWAIGAAWGSVNDEDSLAALHKAVDLGVNFIDTADVYGDGRSERLVAQLRRERSEKIYVATKALHQYCATGNADPAIGRQLVLMRRISVGLLVFWAFLIGAEIAPFRGM